MREIEKTIHKIKSGHQFGAFSNTVAEFLKGAYNQGLQDAADNAEVKQVKYSEDYEIDKESILKLKL